MYKFCSCPKLIPSVLFIVMLVATTRQATVNNCIQSKQEVENGKPFIRCIQCRDGYYVKTGACFPCVYNKIIPVPKNVQCNIMKSFSFGSNIGGIPDPKYNIKNTTDITFNMLNTTIVLNTSKPTNASTVVVMNAVKNQDKIVVENKPVSQEISNSSKSNVNLTAPLQKTNGLNITLNNQKNTSSVVKTLIAPTIKTIAITPPAPITSTVQTNSSISANQPAPVASVIQTNSPTGPITAPVTSNPVIQKNQSTNTTITQKAVQSATVHTTNITNSSSISSKSTPTIAPTTPLTPPTKQNPILSIASQTNSLNQLSVPLSQMLQNCRQLSSDNKCIKCFVGFTVNAGACVKNQVSLSRQNQKGCAVYDQVKNKCLMCDDDLVLNQVGLCQSSQQSSKLAVGPGSSKDTVNTSSTNTSQKIDNQSPSPLKIETVSPPPKPQPIFSKSDNEQLSDKKSSKQPIPPLLNKSRMQQINLHPRRQTQNLAISQNSERIFPKLSQNLKLKLETKPFDLPIFKANNVNIGKYQNQKSEPTLKVLLNIQDANSPNQSYIIQANTDNCAEYINQSSKNKGENKDLQICARCMKDFIWNDLLKRCIQVSKPLQLLKSQETIQKQDKKVEEKQINKLQKVNQSMNVNNASAVVQQSSPSTTITITVNTASPNNTIISITNNPTLKDNTGNASNTSNASTAEAKIEKEVNKNTTSGGGAILLSKSQSNLLSSNTLTTDEQSKGNLALPNSFGTNISNLPNLQPNLIMNSSNLTKQASPSQPMPVPVVQASQTTQSQSTTNNRIPKCIQYKNTSPEALTCKQCETGYKLYQNKCLEPSGYIQALKEAALQRIAVIQNNG